MNSVARFLVALSLLNTLPAVADNGCMVTSGKNIVPLVELYTSEGCSSCPPADRWLSMHLGSNDTNWLAYHVDYWDSIGWPDRFASAIYSQRQRARVNAAGGTAVYTPQVMVGAIVRADWQSERGFTQVLQEAQGEPQALLSLHLDVNPGGLQASLGASNVGNAPSGARVWLAQYLDGQHTEVRAGENSGATLHHDRVVANLWGPWTLGEEPQPLLQDVPLANGTWGLIAFVEDERGNVLQSLALPAAACVATLK